ncbi:unnamed protein product [Durusdinium trenchii]|uniref:Cucumopine synthase C-terminal helical bundle domain-containing protein n=1 Tax=Durusdinium trenchii TaxID=1381693 RepID=A0ABP0SVE0_9DINO
MLVLGLLCFGLAFGSTPEVEVLFGSKGPSISLPDGRRLGTTWHPDADPEFVAIFMATVPCKSFLFHTVSSGKNICFLLPNVGDRSHMLSKVGKGRQARSSCRPGTLFLRHDQMVVLTYGPTQDHQSYMPPILTVDTEDLPALEAFGEEVWTEQLRGESKTPFTLAFTVGKSTVVGGPLFKDELTGNQAVDDAVAAIRSQTTRHWLVPPEEVFVLLSKGHPEEGTAGQKFPPMTIFGGVLMTLTSYAHSGSLNAAASLFAEGPDGVAQADLKIIKRLVNKIGDANLPYLRALSLHTVCESFEQFFRALDQSETVLQVQKLMQAISLFGALMHGWVVYLFPYRLGVGLHVPEMFEPSSHPSSNVPLRS